MTSSLDNAALEVKTKDGVKFGKELREKEFCFAKGFLNLNHGMFMALSGSHTSAASPFSFMGMFAHISLARHVL